MKASVRLLAACKDHQEAFGSEVHGYFTAALIRLPYWENFAGTYEELVKEAGKLLPEMQTPSFTTLNFDQERAFSIAK